MRLSRVVAGWTSSGRSFAAPARPYGRQAARRAAGEAGAGEEVSGRGSRAGDSSGQIRGVSSRPGRNPPVKQEQLGMINTSGIIRDLLKIGTLRDRQSTIP
jgi:hypothetical protein